MNKIIMLLPATTDANLTNAGHIVSGQIQKTNRVVSYVTPIYHTDKMKPHGMNLLEAIELLEREGEQALMDDVIELMSVSGLFQENDTVLLIEGANASGELRLYADYFNQLIANAMQAKIVLVGSDVSPAVIHFYEKQLGFDVLGDQNLSVESLQNYFNATTEQPNTPSIFLYQLVELARKAGCRIALPEGAEPRTVQAALICHEREIAKPVLLGKRAEIEATAKNLNLILPDELEIIEPEAIADRYVDRMIELRKSKGMTSEEARDLLHSNTVVLGTMMLEQNDVQGLVSGAIHTTADTIRPALQLIKTKRDCSQITSSFLMCLHSGVVLYADCAVVPNPDADTLAEVAIQTAETAKSFGMTPRIGLLSYSTGTSGKGPDVDKVRAAVEKVRALRPDLMVEGPLQYDAAADVTVAALKLPNNDVAGRVNVFIFPDLSAGNIAYKAVQRTNGILSIGPVMQGIRKPVNDLSRGATVDDIVYTIAVTAAQAG